MPKLARRSLLALLAVVALLGLLCFTFPHRLAGFAIGMERSRAGLQQEAVDIPGYHIAYLEGGSGEPLILLHGIGADKDNWTRISRWLTPRYHVYALDLPGFGESSKPADGDYTIEGQVKNVAAFAQALHIARFSIVGNSMGGWIAGVYTAEHPDQVISAWLLDPAGVSSAKKSEMLTTIDAGGRVPIFARNADEMRALLGYVFVHPPYIPGLILDEIAREQARNYDLNMKIFGELKGEWTQDSLDKLLDGSKVPTLITWGASDRVLDVSGADILHRLMPVSTLDIMPDIGHVPAVEAPELSARNYLRFRDSVAAPPSPSAASAG